jgi:L-lactate utilization protein LutC
MGVRLDAVMPVLGDKRPNPWMVVAIEHCLFGTAHDQTVEVYKFFAADVAAEVAKTRESEVRSAFVKREVGPDPKCEIGC